MSAPARIAIPAPLKEFLRQPDVAEQLSKLRRLSPWRFVGAVAGNYLAIGGTIALTTALHAMLDSAGSPISLPISLPISIGVLGSVWLIAVVIIAARQHALLVLMHEGAHRTVSTNRQVNDILSDLFCGAPLLVSMRSYRVDHLTHHQHLNSPDDPDWLRKTNDKEQRRQWQFPASAPLTVVLARLYGYSVTYLLRSLAANSQPSTGQGVSDQTISDKSLGRLRLVFYVAIASVLTYTGTWMGFVLFWLAPMLLVLPLLMRIRSIAEHFALRHDHALNQSRTVRAGLIERALIAPHHIGLHIDHHLLASVPFYNLPALHRLLLDCPYYANNAHINEGYFLRRKRPYQGIPVDAEGAILADDMYTQASDRLIAMH